MRTMCQFRNDARLLIIVAAFFFTAMSACVKALGDHVPLYEVVFFRTFLSAAALGGLMMSRGVRFRAKNLPLMLARSLSGFASVSCNFYALGKLSFGDANLLVSTFPVFVAILSFLFLGEKPTKALGVLIALSIAGIALILRPQLGFFNFAGFIALLAAAFSAVVIVVIHQTHETDPSLRIAFYFTGICAFIALPLMIQDFLVPTPLQSLFLVGAAVFGTGGQVFMTKAYGLDDVSRLAPLAYVGVVLSFILGMIFWDEIPSPWSLIGSAVVIASCVAIARLERQPPVVAD
jgi:drug/metabolite transporter (DMT)-like permease